MNIDIYMMLRCRGYSAYLAKMIARACDLTRATEAEVLEGFGGDGVREWDVYAHIINSCINRQRVIQNPRSSLIRHTLRKDKLFQLIKQELNHITDNEKKRLLRFII